MNKRALISVYDKKGIVEFAREILKHHFEIISTSGTARLLQENNIKIKNIEEITQFPEILNGRIKTLHPLIFAGILADRKKDEHLNQAKQLGFELFDLVVVNLYPFNETIKKENCSLEEAIEQIDIGGVSLIRAAAKNFQNVHVLVNPGQYQIYLNSLNNKELDELSAKLASEAFHYVSDYDVEIAKYFGDLVNDESESDDSLDLHLTSSKALRYGENPHQNAKIYYNDNISFYDIFKQIHGKELSYNNILDINAAYNLINEFKEPACAIIKHTNPCGVAEDENITQAYLKALSTDNASAFGGIIIINRRIDINTAKEMDKIFTEIIISSDFDEDALEHLKKKKNRRLIKYKNVGLNNQIEIKTVTGGILVQDKDTILINEDSLKCVTERKPNNAELRDLKFAMKVAKHTKSNSVVYAKNLQTYGIGGGQPSRVDSSKFAIEKAVRFGFDLSGSALASDAFFPFADGVIEAAKAGAKSIIQPGGSIRDEEIVRAANEFGLAMLFTGIRHFKH